MLYPLSYGGAADSLTQTFDDHGVCGPVNGKPAGYVVIESKVADLGQVAVPSRFCKVKCITSLAIPTAPKSQC